MIHVQDYATKTNECPCGSSDDRSIFIICEKCKQKWHNRCCNLSGLNAAAVEMLDDWECPMCYVSPYTFHHQPSINDYAGRTEFPGKLNQLNNVWFPCSEMVARPFSRGVTSDIDDPEEKPLFLEVGEVGTSDAPPQNPKLTLRISNKFDGEDLTKQVQTVHNSPLPSSSHDSVTNTKRYSFEIQTISDSSQSIKLGPACEPYVMHEPNAIDTELKNELAEFVNDKEEDFKTVGEKSRVLYYGIHSYRKFGYIFEPKEMPSVVHKLLNALITPKCPPKQHVNSCLITKYQSGSNNVDMHRDDEPVIDLESLILTVSIGATRTMTFISNDKSNRKDISLEDGSLLITSRYSQDFWKHGYCTEESSENENIGFSFKFRNIAPYFMMSY